MKREWYREWKSEGGERERERGRVGVRGWISVREREKEGEGVYVWDRVEREKAIPVKILSEKKVKITLCLKIVVEICKVRFLSQNLFLRH